MLNTENLPAYLKLNNGGHKGVLVTYGRRLHAKQVKQNSLTFLFQ